MRAIRGLPPEAARPIALALGVAAATALFSVIAFGGATWHYHAGLLDAAVGRVPRALNHLEAFTASARPGDKRLPEAHVVAGRLYAGLQRCLEARRHFEAAGRLASSGLWARAARRGLMTCPDYFPFGRGRSWVYGDSASKGQAMRLEWRSNGARMDGALFAGAKKLREDKASYEVTDWTVWQRDADGRFPLLIFPYEQGRTWKAARGGRRLTYRIEATDAEARTAAGDFTGCLKVRETTAGIKDAWRYDYYCPFVGRALTTVAGPGFENPNTELLEYK